MFMYEIRHAFRLLVREPGFTLAAVLTLALGVGANVAVFAVVQAVLLRPLPYFDAGRLVIVDHRDHRTGITKEFIAIGDYVDLAHRQTVFEGLGGYSDVQGTISGVGEPLHVLGLKATPDLLATLRVHPILGRTLQPEDSRPGAAPVILLGHDLWQSHFGSDPHIAGRGVTLDGIKVQVVGVTPPGFRFPPNARTEVVVPLTVPLEAPAERKSAWTFAVARLKAKASFQQANSELAAISRRLAQEYPRSNEASGYFAVPLRDALVGNTKPALILILGAVGLVLLIACVNVANLLLARSLTRRREMAVRVALGAGRTRLAAQLLAESFALACVAGFAGILVATWGSPALVALVPKAVSVPGLSGVRMDTGVLAFTLGICLATALGCGLISALNVRTETAPGALVGASRITTGLSARRTASVLVIAEVALAVVLLIGAGLMLRSFARLLAVDPGFHADHVITMSIELPADRYSSAGARRAFFDRTFVALRNLPGVKSSGAAVVVPLTGNNWTIPFERPEHAIPAGQRPPEVGWQLASGGYFKTLQIPLLSGRLFDASDLPDGKPVVMISQAIEQRYFPNERAVGRQIKLGDLKLEIVGVVGDIRRAELRDEPRADMYFPLEQNPTGPITMFIRTEPDPLKVLPLLQNALRAMEPGVAVIEARTMTDIARESVQITQFALWLLGLFAAIALTLAAVGIYGIMSYVVRQRTHEIGTRVALGATRKDIVWLIMQQGVGIAALGTAIGLAVGLVAARALASILYGTSVADPATFTVAAVVLIATTMAACYLPARHAASIDPARTLAES